MHWNASEKGVRCERNTQHKLHGCRASQTNNMCKEWIKPTEIERKIYKTEFDRNILLGGQRMLRTKNKTTTKKRIGISVWIACTMAREKENARWQTDGAGHTHKQLNGLLFLHLLVMGAVTTVTLTWTIFGLDKCVPKRSLISITQQHKCHLDDKTGQDKATMCTCDVDYIDISLMTWQMNSQRIRKQVFLFIFVSTAVDIFSSCIHVACTIDWALRWRNLLGQFVRNDIPSNIKRGKLPRTVKWQISKWACCNRSCTFVVYGPIGQPPVVVSAEKIASGHTMSTCHRRMTCTTADKELHTEWSSIYLHINYKCSPIIHALTKQFYRLWLLACMRLCGWR